MAKPSLGNLAFIVRQGGYTSTITPPTDVDVNSPVIMDVATNYGATYSGTVTNQPVSDKTDRTDHYRINNPKFNIRGGLSTATLDIYDWTWGDAGDDIRIDNYVKEITDIMRSKDLVTVYMPNGIIANNCVITNAAFIKQAPEGNYMNINLEMQQIQVITSAVNVESVTDSTYQSEVNGGHQSGETTQNLTFPSSENTN